MGFWIFMFVMDLLIPATMILIGRVFMKKPPKTINSLYGYRTASSMRTKETWEFAHQYSGKIWFYSGWVILFPSMLGMLFVLKKDADVIGTVGGILCMAQCIPMAAVIIPTERALQKEFDQDGKRRTNR